MTRNLGEHVAFSRCLNERAAKLPPRVANKTELLLTLKKSFFSICFACVYKGPPVLLPT